MTTLARVTRALGALAALVGLLVGAPYMLLRVGNSPLRRTDDLGAALHDLVSAPIDDHIILGLITVAIWLLWAVFAICVARELFYAARGTGRRSSRPLRFTGPFQLVAHRLIACILLIGVTTTTISAAPFASRPAAALAHAHPTDPPPPHQITPQPAAAPAPTPVQQPPASETTLTVSAGDTAWDLAEAHLGDGMRWLELWQLNNSRVQLDGRVWSEPDLLLPGWELAVPAPGATGTVTGNGTAITVAAGDTAWDLAETHLGDGMRWPELWQLNNNQVQGDGRVWSDPEALTPGWTLELPATPPGVPASSTTVAPSAPSPPLLEAGEPSDSDQPVAPGSAPPAPAQPDVSETTTASPEPPAQPTAPPAPVEPDEDTSTPAVPVGLLGVASTMLAVAVLRSLRRRRSQRAARLPVSAMPPPPPRSTRSTARELLAQADESAVDRLDAALANLAAGLRPRSGQPCAQPRLVQVTGARIEVLLDRADPAPPPPWRPEASGQIWVLDPDVDVAASDAASPLPALVTLGVGDSDILIDLEAYGVVSLAGDVDACWALTRSMVTELSARADGTIGIEVIGDELQGHVADLAGVTVLDSWDQVDTDIIGGSGRMLDAGRWPHTFAARASGRMFDGWAPALWICTPSDHPRYHDTVRDIARRPGAGSAIVVAGADDDGCGLRIVLDADGTFDIPSLGLSGQAQQLAAATVEDLVNLLDDAGEGTALAQTLPFPAPSQDENETFMPLPDMSTGAGSPGATAITGSPCCYEDPGYRILVRVCGEIRVEGGKDTLPPRESAVATYIALHGEVDLDQIRDAVWGGTDVSRKRVRNVISGVRRSLGDAISFVDEGRVKASDQIATDLDLIRRRLAYARHQDDREARAETLHGALDWVSGKVCTYPSTARRSWTWIDLDNWISNVESLVGTVAYELATLYLELSDPTGAAWAARRGIDATGAREQLTLLLVDSYELAGDEPAAASALRSYEQHMADLGADDHSERLLAALDRYLPPRARHAG